MFDFLHHVAKSPHWMGLAGIIRALLIEFGIYYFPPNVAETPAKTFATRGFCEHSPAISTHRRSPRHRLCVIWLERDLQTSRVIEPSTNNHKQSRRD